jgi:hypothetical protein
MRTFVPADVEAWSRIIAAREPETRRQRIGRWLRLPVIPAPVLVRAHHVSAPVKRSEWRRARLAYRYGMHYVQGALYKHRTGEEFPVPIGKSLMRPPPSPVVSLASAVLAAAEKKSNVVEMKKRGVA